MNMKQADIYYHRDTCRACLSTTVERVIDIPATPIGDNYIKSSGVTDIELNIPLDLYFCYTCKLLQLLDVANPDHIYRNYIYNTSHSLGLVEHFNHYANMVVQRFNIPEKSLCLDIGCNDGTLLKVLRQLDMSILGLEPAIEIAKNNNNNKINTICDYFSSQVADSIAKEYGQFDLIFANNVAANIDDLQDFFRGIATAISTRGVFILESGYGLDLLRKYILDNIYHEHFSYLTVTAVNHLCRQFGLEVFEVGYVDTKGGSLRYYIQKSGGNQPISGNVVEFLELEAKELNSALCVNFRDHILLQKEKLAEIVFKARQAGQRISGFGASVGITTLLHYFELGDKVLALADDNQSRHGLLSPGHHIPVEDPVRVFNDTDLMIIFPWRYAKPILSKYFTRYSEKVDFVVPLPSVSTIKSLTEVAA